MYYLKSIREIVASTTNDVTFEEKRLFSLRLCTESIATPSNFKESRITKAQSLHSGTFPGLTHTNQVRNLSRCGSASLRVIWGYSYLLFRVVRKSKRVNIFFFQHAWFFLFYWIFQDRIAVEGDEWEWEVHWRHRAALRPGSRQVAGEKRGLKKAGAMAARGAGEARPTGEGCHVKSVC